MALAAHAPNIDDRDFERIVREARALIPRYAPEWTDLNESDPGITLVQLFAWMTDLLIYRINQVPDLNYIKFLQLLGIELLPARPARAELSFTLALPNVEVVAVPRGAQVAAPGADGKPLIFETDESLLALGAKLIAIQSFDGFTYSVESKKNETRGQTYNPFGRHPREGAALLLGFDFPGPFTSQQINLTVWLDAPSGPVALLCETGAEPLQAALIWEFWDGKRWVPFNLDKDETRAFTLEGHIYFPGPGADFKKRQIGVEPRMLYWFRVRVESSQYERPPVLDAILTNTVRATQASTVRDEILGGSDGLPNQFFQLTSAPILTRDRPERIRTEDGRLVTIRSLRLEVDEGISVPGALPGASTFRLWEEVDDFFDSAPDDPHYRLNRTTGEVFFGDGTNGRIPVANPANPNGNIVAREYRFGGGIAGNVPAEKIKDLQISVPGVASVKNLRAAIGGVAEETLAHAKLRAPLELKSKGRAVTAEDFEELALQTPGTRIRRARALPLTHPKYRGAQIPGVITTIIVPDAETPNPTPSPATLALVCKHLNAHRLLTSELYVAPPVYRLIRIEVDLIVSSDGDLAETKRALESGLTDYFHPLRGGEWGEGWAFGGTIFYSEVYRQIIGVSGASRIRDNQLLIYLDGQLQTFCRDVPINPGELLYSEGHDVKVAYT